MEVKTFETDLSDFSKIFSIRFEVGFYNPFSEENSTLKIIRKGHKTVKLRFLVKKIFQGPQIRILDSIPNGEIGLITIENIVSFPLEIDPNNLNYVLSDIVKNSDLLKKGDILTPRVRGLGNVSLINEDDKYISSENVLVIRLKEEVKKEFILKFIAYYLSTIGRKQILTLQTGGRSGSINQNLLKEVLIPEITFDVQEKIVKKIEKIEVEIKEEKQKLVSLQDVIGRVFIKYGVKNTKFEKKELEAFTTDAISIGNQKFLRCGPQYRAFWDVHRGLLFENKTKHSIVKLGSVMQLHKTKTLKKGILDVEYMLLDLEDLEQFTGRILNKENLVLEIGSNKTLFGDADIIVSKIDPYLGYTFLNDSSKPLIGSTELLPYKVNKNLALSEYVKCLLLSHEYIFNSGLIMYGKRHPRIHPLDIINIKIPLPDLDIQKKIVEEIQKQEIINEEAEQKINELREKINKTIFNVLKNRG